MSEKCQIFYRTNVPDAGCVCLMSVYIVVIIIVLADSGLVCVCEKNDNSNKKGRILIVILRKYKNALKITKLRESKAFISSASEMILELELGLIPTLSSQHSPRIQLFYFL